MKIHLTIINVLLAGLIQCRSQGFINLNFESSKLTNIVYFGYPGTVATVTGWAYSGVNPVNGDPNTFPYNSTSLDAPAVILEGTNNPYGPSSIQGKYSIYLQGGSAFQSATNGASIWQTATISASSLSIYYWGGPLQVSFNGQALAFNAISNAPVYTVWGADISAYAGQTGELLFNAPWQSAALLDNIQFSTTSVPEPTTLVLTALGTLLLGCRLRKKQAAHKP